MYNNKNNKNDSEEGEESVITVAALEGGGTTFVVAVAKIFVGKESDDDTSVEIIARREVDSSHDEPRKTLEECASFFR
eukprot:CAMPEP_0194174582 /NCGR_PEP_ID=MMETSP0154-20130528/8748_1 /TAXON_ID=1049557 /ORGANISM="Thalassiothrix antarctica, Strain L6-D1" /LENGTH=77 /DNA_ID=CAMNT_0038888055 /DNA_START=41 /DNA_END=271 /DNA_ORIENTATION=+